MKKSDRFLSILLTIAMVLSLLPAAAIPARAANPDPVYRRDGAPEVVIYNYYTGNSSKYFQANMQDGAFNAVAAGAFGALRYGSKITDVKKTYPWNYHGKSFYQTNLASLQDQYQQLQTCFAVTLNSTTHKHSFKKSNSIRTYEATITGAMNAGLYFKNQGTMDVNRFLWAFVRNGNNRKSDSTRFGNNQYTEMPDIINGANSSYLWVNGTKVTGDTHKYELGVEFQHSKYTYGGGQGNTYFYDCTCGGSAEGSVVCFYDGTNPTVRAVKVTDAAGNPCKDFKPGDVVNVVLECTEAIRFADDSASGKGGVYIGLMVEGATDRLYANLTKLEKNTLTFTYTVPANDTGLYAVRGVELTAAPSGGTALIHSSADIARKELYNDGSRDQAFTRTRRNDDPERNELGFSKTTSYVTDMAGNALSKSAPSTAFYIDCQEPFVALAAVSADTKNGDVKEILNKTGMDPNSENYEDDSDRFLGVGDTFSVTIYMSEVVRGTNATVTTNVKKANGSYLALPVANSGTTAANGIGSQYGKGASNGSVSVLYTAPVTIESGMTVEGGTMKITAVNFTSVHDASGNAAQSVSGTDVKNNVDKQYGLDTLGPIPNTQGAVHTEYGFYVPFTVTDASSGVLKLPASLIVGGGDCAGEFEYAITASTSMPSTWSKATQGTSLSFEQTGLAQYLHVRPIAGQSYDVSKLIFNLSDYAGNIGTAEVSLTGVGMDTVGPVVTADTSSRAYDNANTQGTLTVNFTVKDSSTVSAVSYQWSDTEPDADDAGWSAGNLTGTTGVASAAMTVSETVAPGASFGPATLWVRAEDADGNVSVTSLGEYEYDLSGIKYSLTYPTGVTANPVVSLSMEDGPDYIAAAIVDVVRASEPGVHYVYNTVSSESNICAKRSYTTYAERKTNDDGTLEYLDGSNAASYAPFYYWTGIDQSSWSPTSYTGDVIVTVYTGKYNTEDGIKLDTQTHSLSQADIWISTNALAQAKTFTLHLSPDDAKLADTFPNATLTDEAHVVERYVDSLNRTDAWKFDSGESVSATLEGVKLTLDLGADKNGWGYADIDWDNSYIAIGPVDSQQKLCNLGAGSVQTVTLPASDLYTSGVHTLRAVLARHSSANPYRIPLLHGNSSFLSSYQCWVDATEPGSVKPELLLRQNWQQGVYDNDYAYSTYSSEIFYDPDATVYIPADGCTTRLSVRALDASGELATVTTENTGGGTGLFGALDVVAWNAAAPNNVVSLSGDYFYKDENGEFEHVSGNTYIPNTMNDGRRSLQFTTTGATATGVLRLTPNQDNVVALQVRYANGKASAVTYLTVHPVSNDLRGTIAASVTGTGILTDDPGEASVTFTPSVPVDPGLAFYCTQGYRDTAGMYHLWVADSRESEYAMTREGDAWVFRVPDANESEYKGAEKEWDDDPNSVGNYPERYGGVIMYNWSGGNYHDQTCFEGSPWAQPAGFYAVYARDAYGNLSIVGVTSNGIIADATAPRVKETDHSMDGMIRTRVFTVKDDSLYGGDAPMTLDISLSGDYADAVGATGKALTLTGVGDGYHWTASEPNAIGVFEVNATLTRSGSYDGTGTFPDNDGYTIATYAGGCTDAYLTVEIKYVCSPQIKEDVQNLKAFDFSLTVTDAHGNAAGISQNVGYGFGKAGEEIAVSAEYKPTGEGTDRALYLTFETPVQPDKSWINRDVEGFATEWHDAFPIWTDGTWTIGYTDLLGNHYTQELTLNDVFGEYGIDFGISTLDYVKSDPGVVITAEADKAADGETVTGGVIATENGTYTVKRTKGDEVDTLKVHLNNIISGAPEETLYFYFDEFMERYTADTLPRPITTIGTVRVSYETDRETNPDGATSQTFKAGDSGDFSFRYYDVPTDHTYTVSGSLAAYGITLEAPPVPYSDEDAPVIDMVTIWKRQGGGYTQANAFSGSASENDINKAFENAGAAKSYSLAVSASDYSNWKVVVKSYAPASMSYAAAASDEIAGVTLSGNAVMIEKDVASDFYLVVVDNAATETAAAADNFSFVKITRGSIGFDTTPPVIATVNRSVSLYERIVYVKATDKNDVGASQAADSVTIEGPGLVINNDDIAVSGVSKAEYPYKLIFNENVKDVVITATDAAGNTATYRFDVSGIDTSAPVLTTKWSPCFKDGGGLNQESPTAGPVKTDVVALITSDKEIVTDNAKLKAVYTVGDGAETECVFAGTTATEAWGSVEYTSQRVTVRFSVEDEVKVTVTVTAPNNKSTTATLRLRDGVIDKTEPAVVTQTSEEVKRAGAAVPYAVKHTVVFDEDVYCMNAGKSGEVYNPANPFVLTVTENGTQDILFADKAGNLTKVPLTAVNIDSVAPKLSVEVPENADATNGAVNMTLTVSENCTLSASSDIVSFPTPLTSAVVGGKTVYQCTVAANENGTFRLTATDSAGNKGTASITINNIDKTLPVISFDSSTVSLRQESAAAVLTALLEAGVHTWDNVALVDGSLAYDDTGVDLGAPGVYAVVYTVADTAGNVAQATRYVKVIDKNQPVITVDGKETEPDGVLGLSTGTHTLSVSGLKLAGEPYTVKLIKGIYSEGQMKRVSAGIAVGADGRFTLDAPGVYTLYIVTQSRQTYRTLFYVEN